jgi:hypothetical protein
VKGIVSKAAMKGMQDNITVFMPIVKNEANKLTRRKRSGSKEKMDQVSLKRIGTIKRPSSKNLSENDNDEQATSTLSQWYSQAESVIETIRDLVEALPSIVKIGVTSVLVLWFMYSWLRSGSQRSSSKENRIVHSPVISRAVYLRDINEGLLNADKTPIYAHSER